MITFLKGVGKTQFLIKTCSSFLFTNSFSKEKIIYIDTENNFCPERFDIFIIKVKLV